MKRTKQRKEVITGRVAKSIAGITCAAVLFATNGMSAFAESDKVKFSDVPDGHFAKASIEFCNPNIMTGTGGDKFEPDATLTRAQAVQILYKVDGGYLKGEPAVFSDVKPGEWFSDALNYAVTNKFCTGYPDGTFKPGNLLTYEEFAMMVYNHANYEYPMWVKTATQLDDAPKCPKYSPWAKRGINFAEILKVSADPQNVDATLPITRAQAAVFAHKAATTQFKVAQPSN